MKQLTLAGFSLLIFVSCTDNRSQIDKNLFLYIQKYSHDPKSYEPLETKIIDTIYLKALANKTLSDNKSELDKYKNALRKDSLEILESKNNGLYNDFKDIINSNIQTDNVYIASCEDKVYKITRVIDSVSTSKNPNPVFMYTGVHRYRAKNKMGALNLFEDYFQCDADWNLLIFTDDKKNITADPNLLHKFTKIDL